MITRLTELSTDRTLDADICIVGSGPAGLSLAKSLEGSAAKIVLLESGDFDYDIDTQDLSAGPIDGALPSVPLNASRLRLFGGTSMHWSGNCGPFEETDFEQREWVNLSGWPVTRAEMMPFYEKAAALIGLKSNHFEAADWQHAGDSRRLRLGSGDFQHAVLLNQPTRFGTEYRAFVEKSNEILAILRANLSRIHLNPERNKVTALEVRSLTGGVVMIRPKTTILACGGVENARLMLLSGLDRQLPAVGRYFSFHPRLASGHIALGEPMTARSSPYGWQTLGPANVRYHIRLTAAAQHQYQLPNHAIVLDYAQDPRVASFPALGRLQERARGERNLPGINEDVLDLLGNLGGLARQARARYFPRVDRLSMVTYFEQAPNVDSRIVLADEVDTLGLRRSRVCWRHSDEDFHSVTRFHERLAREIGGSGLGRLFVNPEIATAAGFLEYMKNESGGGHQLGTTRMSTGPSTGVVDANGRVHGIEGLYCAGASVFPTTSWINPTMTIVALAARLAQHLRERA